MGIECIVVAPSPPRVTSSALRGAIQPTAGVRAWSRSHESRLSRVTFDEIADQVVFEDYRQVAAAAAERVKRLEAVLLRVAGGVPRRS
jgi:hypothetical protein